MDDLTKSALIRRMVSKPGLRAKVDAKCLECIYDPYADGTWRKQVEESEEARIDQRDWICYFGWVQLV